MSFFSNVKNDLLTALSILDDYEYFIQSVGRSMKNAPPTKFVYVKLERICWQSNVPILLKYVKCLSKGTKFLYSVIFLSY